MKKKLVLMGTGGSKIGTGAGQRENSVSFIFMTGHANSDNNVGDGKPKNQADLITAYCKTNKYLCLDYYSIDSHCMNDNYWAKIMWFYRRTPWWDDRIGVYPVGWIFSAATVDALPLVN